MDPTAAFKKSKFNSFDDLYSDLDMEWEFEKDPGPTIDPLNDSESNRLGLMSPLAGPMITPRINENSLESIVLSPSSFTRNPNEVHELSFRTKDFSLSDTQDDSKDQLGSILESMSHK